MGYTRSKPCFRTVDTAERIEMPFCRFRQLIETSLCRFRRQINGQGALFVSGKMRIRAEPIFR